MNPIIDTNPDLRLVNLLKEDCDGGNGEFEDFVPEEMRKFIEENPNESCVASLQDDGSVIWGLIGHEIK